jgi:molecular chaperone GrpE
MSEERRGGAPEDGEPQVKVVDRRRFTAHGEPLDQADEGAPEKGGEAERAAPPDERERELAALATRVDELTRAYASLVEDNKAFRARMEREKARVVEAERSSVAQALLEAADDLERALAAVTVAGETQPGALGNLTEGVRLSLASLHKRIADLGAQRIVVKGQRFDPHVAEAIDTVAVGDAAQDGVVLHEVRPGYRIGDRVLRPARVRVGRLAQA